MALESSVPPITPDFLGKLRMYLLFRDFRAPSVKPQPRAIVTFVDASGMDIDRLAWDYLQPKAGRGVPADGFILWFNRGAGLEVGTGGIKLSIDARAYDMLWPATRARSYALVAYRNTYQGEQATDRVFDESWVNVT